MSPARRESTQHQSAHRNSVITLVTSPLGFFTLVVLVVEALIGGLAATSASTDRFEILVAMSAILMFLVMTVSILAYLRPGVLYGRSNAIYSVVISPPSDMPGLEMAQMSWSDDRCFLNFRRSKMPIVPVIGEAGVTFEVRIPPEVLFELTSSDTIRIELIDQHGLRWDAGPFYVHQRPVRMTSRSNRAAILAAYGSDQ